MSVSVAAWEVTWKVLAVMWVILMFYLIAKNYATPHTQQECSVRRKRDWKHAANLM
jgi:hypothetical protein